MRPAARFWALCAATLLVLGLQPTALHAQDPAPAAPAASAPDAAASAPEQESAAASAPTAAPPPPPPPPSCAQLSARAASADLRATTAQSQMKELEQVAQLLDESIRQWELAAASCEGHARERAQRNLADNEKARTAVAERLAAGSQCETSHRDAASLQELAAKAFGERRWTDAALLYRKAETMWDVAAENCSGGQQQLALRRREQSEIDAHNAEFCAPLFDRAREYTQKFRAATAAGLSLQERQQQSQVAETLWRDAARQCRGSALELAGNNAQALARERGTPWVATAPPAPPKLALPAYGLNGKPTAAAAPTAPTAPIATVAPVATAPTPGAAAITPAAPQPAPAATAAAEPILPAGARDDAKELDVQAGDTRYRGRFVREEGQVLTGTGRVEWANGDVYEGPLLRNERHGRGTLSWANGQRYSGDWVRDRAVGQGQVHFANGNDYEGAIADGLPQGEGRMRYASGDVYQGPMNQGVKTGRGSYTWINGQRYEGEWADDKPSGQGRLQFANGNRYEGSVVDGVPKGKGRMVFASGDVYEGTFERGQAEGQGSYVWKSGDRYQGGWLAGRKQGQGVFIWASGDKWEGVFKNDEQTGDGVLTRKGDK